MTQRELNGLSACLNGLSACVNGLPACLNGLSACLSGLSAYFGATAGGSSRSIFGPFFVSIGWIFHWFPCSNAFRFREAIAACPAAALGRGRSDTEWGGNREKTGDNAPSQPPLRGKMPDATIPGTLLSPAVLTKYELFPTYHATSSGISYHWKSLPRHIAKLGCSRPRRR